jgi:hypothetical protein
MASLTLPAAAWSATAESSAAEAQTDALIRQLARPAPASVAFTEVRLSKLLQQPLVVSGELDYSGPASLDRRVMQPYQEHTSIRGESVRVERAGEATRSFALKRAPELGGLLQSFSALLSGDAAALRRNFTIESQQNANHWVIRMTPLDTRTRKRVTQLQAVGHDAQPRCFTLLTAGGGANVTLLGAAANESLPAQATLEQLDALCRRSGS